MCARFLPLALFLSSILPLGAQTVVNSTFVFEPGHSSAYSDPANWMPAEVPNNTGDKQYNVTIGPYIGVTVDIDATISNLTLPSTLGGLRITEHNFTVTGETINQADASLTIESGNDTPATFDAGTLSTFSNNVLRGKYYVISSANPATFAFKGAQVTTLSDGALNLFGPLSAVVDESGHDALSNLAQIDATGSLALLARSLVTNAPFQNDGSLSISAGEGLTSFIAAAGLINFDSGTGTLTGGSFQLSSLGSLYPTNAVELRFNGANIVNLASSLMLIGPATRVADLAGNDGLRNLARISPGGALTLNSQARSIPGQFQNDGLLSLVGARFIVDGGLANFDPSTRTLSGGSFSLSQQSQLEFPDADIVQSASAIRLSYAGTITDLASNDALRNFSHNLPAGDFVLDHDGKFTAPGDFTNEGRVETVPLRFQTRSILPAGQFTVSNGFRYLQTGGQTINNGFLIAPQIEILGGTFSGAGTVQGSMLVKNATLIQSYLALFNGDLTLSPESRFRYVYYFAYPPREIEGTVTIGGTLEVDIPSESFVGSTAVLPVLRSTMPLNGVFANAPPGARIPTVDGKGSVVVEYGTKEVYVRGYQAQPPPIQLLNISSRAFLSASSDDPSGTRSVIIGGFIISGLSAQKEVVLRGLGPSLASSGLAPVIGDPVLELHAANGSLIATNDDWKQASGISEAGLAPPDDHESALRATLSPGTYTVIVRDKNGQAGHALVEIYDLTQNDTSKLANISTRGFTNAANVLIGGLIAGGPGQANAEVVARALGPALKNNGIPDALDDPTLEIWNSNGVVIAFDDDYDYYAIAGTGLVPSNSTESALHLSLPPGNYTAIVRGKGNTGGVALVEFYDLRR